VKPRLIGQGALRALALVSLLWIGIAADCWAQADNSSAESQVKAAFLYKFLNFVEWPPQSFASGDSPIVIGVVGADRIAEELALVLANRNANGRPVVARRLQRGDSVAGLHMLFIGRAETRANDWLNAAKTQPLLTVSETDDAFAQGSTINFVVVENKVRFDVALRPAEQGNLKISSRLLAVARKVV